MIRGKPSSVTSLTSDHDNAIWFFVQWETWAKRRTFFPSPSPVGLAGVGLWWLAPAFFRFKTLFVNGFSRFVPELR
jgi:hypothetical protein